MENKEEKNCYNFIVTLTPLEQFFFGAENRNTDNTEKYYQTSLQIPQQTTVLGAMRFLILQKAGKDIFNNNKIIDPDKAKEYIGKNSFNMAADTSYGIIESLSEVVLWKHKEEPEDGLGDSGSKCKLTTHCMYKEKPQDEFGDCLYFPLINFAKKIEGEKVREKKMKFSQSKEDSGKYFFEANIEENEGKNIETNVSKSAAYIDNYKAKDGSSEIWVNEKGDFFDSDQIFIPQVQGGNYKNKKNKIEDDHDAYFKMRFYRFGGNFSFVFNMRLRLAADDDLLLNKLLGSHFINLGGERSKFICKIEKSDDHPEKIIRKESLQKAYSSFFIKDNVVRKVILTSDACFSDELYSNENLLFATVSIKKLRFNKTIMEGKVEERNYHNRGGNGFTQSKLFNLIQRGSILYFKKDTCKEEIDNLLNDEAFKTIGYNKYCIVD